MIKKKAEKKVAARKGAKRKGTPKNELNPAAVREDISKLVEEHAGKMAEAVIGEGEKGQLAPVKYLFEVAHIFPPTTDGSQATKDEECLAKTLLDRLDLPDKPVVRDDEDEDVVVIPAKRVAELEGNTQRGSEGSAGEEEEDPVVG